MEVDEAAEGIGGEGDADADAECSDGKDAEGNVCGDGAVRSFPCFRGEFCREGAEESAAAGTPFAGGDAGCGEGLTEQRGERESLGVVGEVAGREEDHFAPDWGKVRWRFRWRHEARMTRNGSDGKRAVFRGSVPGEAVNSPGKRRATGH